MDTNTFGVKQESICKLFELEFRHKQSSVHVICEKGVPTNKENPIHVVDIIYAIEFYYKKLIKRKISTDVIINILLVPNTHISGGALDYYDYDKDDHSDFEVDLILDKTLPRYNMLLVIAHEMAHLEQVLTGRMSSGKTKKYTCWEGKQIQDNKGPYHLLPWEIEARLKENILFEQFIKHTSPH